MSLNIECEARNMLLEKQYNLLLKDFCVPEINFIKQINHYIENEDFSLRNLNRQSLRIREIDGSISELTLKIKGCDGDREYNETLDEVTKLNFFNHNVFPEGEIKTILLNSKVELSKLKVLTSLSTIRYERKIDDYLIVIDKNEYNGITDYNIEIESNSVARANEVMENILKKYNIQKTINYKTKSKRAIETRNKK